MKISQSLLTHAAVFVVGASIAVVATRPNSSDKKEVSESAANGRLRSGRMVSSSSSGEKSRTSSSRDRRDLGDQAGSKGSATERMSDIVRTADPLERHAALLDLVNRLGPDEFAAVADRFREMDHFEGSGGEFDIILRGWAKADPFGALEYAAQQDNRKGETSTILSAWAGTDASAAERWALDHHEGEGANRYLTAVIRGVAAYDVTRASELALSMPSSRERGYAMDAITRALFVAGVDDAMAFPSTIEDPSLRAGYVDMISRRLASKDAGQAATWLASMPDSDSQVRAARRVGAALAKQDVKQAAAWVGKLSPQAQAEAARGVIAPMSSGDITGTAQWVSTLNGIPNYDRVVEEFVWSCDQRAPEQSAAWIQGVSNPDQQRRLYHRMLGEWSKRDRSAVKEWVANNEVPADVAKRFKK